MHELRIPGAAVSLPRALSVVESTSLSTTGSRTLLRTLMVSEGFVQKGQKHVTINHVGAAP
jgi:hypothetical protein